MYGVVRFLDHPLLPADTPNDYPKIVKSGIDEEGQHHKSPPISGPCGIMTLFYKLGRPDFIEKLLDVEGTKKFEFRIDMSSTSFQDSYIERQGKMVEIGFYGSTSGQKAQHGVRYRIHDPDPNLPYRIGKWEPLCTSDLGYPWGGTQMWIRGQSAALCKGIWWHKHWRAKKIAHISWSGMSPETREEINRWMEQCQIDLAEIRAKEREEGDRFKELFKGSDELSAHMALYWRLQLRCHADCGVEYGKYQCGKCKRTRYCSTKCQKDDWKYHKDYCGKEDPIPQDFIDIFTRYRKAPIQPTT